VTRDREAGYGHAVKDAQGSRVRRSAATGDGELVDHDDVAAPPAMPVGAGSQVAAKQVLHVPLLAPSGVDDDRTRMKVDVQGRPAGARVELDERGNAGSTANVGVHL
jgi:hypothetical protein